VARDRAAIRIFFMVKPLSWIDTGYVESTHARHERFTCILLFLAPE